MKHLLFIIAAIVSLSVFAQPAQNVRGKVFDSETNFPLFNVKVEIIGNDSVTKYRAVTDTEGLFELKNIPVGKYSLTTRLEMYDFKSTSIIVNSGKETVIQIPLNESFRTRIICHPTYSE